MKAYKQKNTITFLKRIGKGRSSPEIGEDIVVLYSEIGKSGVVIDEYKEQVFGNAKNSWVITGFEKEVVKA